MSSTRVAKAVAWLVAVAILMLCGACSSPHREPVADRPASSTAPAASAPDGPPASTLGGDVAAENHLPGGSWQLRHRSVHGEIQGFASRTSVRRGQPVTLFVSTTARTYVVRAFRMGWYGGRQGRLVWTSAALPGHRQTAVRTIAATHTVSAHWQPGPVLETGSWPAGDYLLRLDAANGYSRFVPLAVRSGSAYGKVVLVQAVTTWQAYSDWGGYTLYRGPGGAYSHRARAVSFDRPYDDSSSVDRDGSGQFLHRELPVVALAEQLGLPLEYITDVDLHADPHLLDGALAVVTMGHDEYWSLSMRAAVERARDRGVDLAFLGANAVYRRIRFASSPLGPNRIEINYKVAAEDPRRHHRDVTTDWPAPPHARDESSLVGQAYDCFPVRSDQVVVSPRNWLFAGTGVHAGTRLHLVVGPESDRVDRAVSVPGPLEVLAHTRLSCRGRTSASDVTWYTTPSGAGVFASGSIDWVCSITGAHCRGGGGATSTVVRGVTANLLRAFAAGQAGRVHPARDNVATVLR